MSSIFSLFKDDVNCNKYFTLLHHLLFFFSSILLLYTIYINKQIKKKQQKETNQTAKQAIKLAEQLERRYNMFLLCLCDCVAVCKKKEKVRIRTLCTSTKSPKHCPFDYMGSMPI